MSIHEIIQELETSVKKLYDVEEKRQADKIQELEKDIEEFTKLLASYGETIDTQKETIADYEKATYFEVENLREEQIVEKFGELFAKKDYRLLEAMLENYDLL